MRAKLNHLVLVRRAAIQFLRGFEHHARRMIDATAIPAEIDAIDDSALSIRPESIDANGQLTARLTGIGTGTVHPQTRDGPRPATSGARWRLACWTLDSRQSRCSADARRPCANSRHSFFVPQAAATITLWSGTGDRPQPTLLQTRSVS